MFEPGQVVSRLKGHRRSPDYIMFSKNGELVATASAASEDMNVIIYSMKTWDQMASFKFEDLVRTKRNVKEQSSKNCFDEFHF